MKISKLFDAVLGFLEENAPAIHAFVTSQSGQSKLRHALQAIALAVAAKSGLFNQSSVETFVDLAVAVLIQFANYLWSQHLAKANDKATTGVQ